MKVLITGCAGFIGYHATLNFCNQKKNKVFGIDNINSYYDVSLKKSRLQNLKKLNNFYFTKLDLTQKKKLDNYFKKNNFDKVIHLAAQAGVRYSIKNPDAHVNSNIIGYSNLLEVCKNHNIKHLVFASSSSVYGSSNVCPYRENMNTDKTESIYAATKKAGEVMSYSYSHLHNLPITVLRFFTVYGPYGRPDMAIYKFTEGIVNNKTIKLYNYGQHLRDFTYVDDVVNSIMLVMKKIPSKKKYFEIYNVGSGKPKSLMFFLSTIEKKLHKVAKTKKVKLQEGDVYKTHSDISKIKKDYNFKPSVNIQDGIELFIKWYKKYHNI